ncbi:hypothetical protein KP509_34G019900 [Ceratopteris richardii]|uniref:UPF3 domain-containing protein n=1 Tax=Ceratopteris richardii TaxID=49495 RepID=A0A8T2QHV0_CERRI|nr:hypothetical protein KP509_34G019900 [Ceratopteris richardii]
MGWTSAAETSAIMLINLQHVYNEQDCGINLAAKTKPVSYPFRLQSHMISVSGETRGGDYKFKSSTLSSSVMTGSGRICRRTKVVVRHLPPGLSETAFMEEVVPRFSPMYNLVTFYRGKASVRSTSYSWAYIDFKHPEHVVDFYQGFNGHVFVSEKGTQYKAIVEYAPNQRVPKSWSKKDPREGSIYQDPDYVKFTEQIARPIENLPSAEAQLEKKEAERNLNSVPGGKETIIITPLMEFVRQKRALKSMPQKSVPGKVNSRGGGFSAVSSNKTLLKRGSDRTRDTLMYAPGPRPKEKATYVPRYEESQRRGLSADKKGMNGLEQAGLKGFAGFKSIVVGLDKEESTKGLSSGDSECPRDSKVGIPIERNRDITSTKGLPESYQNIVSEDLKPTQCIETPGRLNKGPSSSRTPFSLQKSDQLNDPEKRYPKVWKSMNKEVNYLETEASSSQINIEEKHESSCQDARCLQSKERPDRPLWAVRQRGNAARYLNNVAIRPVSPPVRPGRGKKQLDNSPIPDLSKPPGKRIGSSVMYGGQEKQVWVAKPGSGS